MTLGHHRTTNRSGGLSTLAGLQDESALLDSDLTEELRGQRDS